MDVAEVAADLVSEQQALDEVAADQDREAWSRATASPRWTVADQVLHLTHFDGAAATATPDPDHTRTTAYTRRGVAGGGAGALAT